MYMVFTQSEEGSVDGGRLTHHAEQFFGATLTVAERGGGAGAGPGWQLGLRSRGGAYDGRFELRARKTAAPDLLAARDAEARGGVMGLEALASRCAYVWELQAGEGTPEQASYLMCAILASVGLGPILPPERDALLGVRGARERAERGDEGYRSPPRVQ